MKTIAIFLFIFLFLSATILSGAGHRAMFWEPGPEPQSVQCRLCPRNCLIPSGSLGFCKARKNQQGILYALGYGKPCSVAVDPIEKKPFFHFLPGTRSFSIASAGCSLRCKFCQNWQISQFSPEETTNYDLPPEEVVRLALEKNCASIAYTYSEPLNFYEYVMDTAAIAKRKGLKNVMHTAGFVNAEPLEKLAPLLDAVNVDLKGFTEEYYKNMCGGSLEVVLNSLKILKKAGVWIEITVLIVPGYNDSEEEIKKLCLWVRKELGENTPVHFSRFYPMYQLTHLPATPYATLEKAYRIAKSAGLKYVYVGNVAGNPYENTVCPHCGKIVVRRQGFSVLENNIKNGRCKYCGARIAGVW
jgi:pyruvate formate lyase activating enzyme